MKKRNMKMQLRLQFFAAEPGGDDPGSGGEPGGEEPKPGTKSDPEPMSFDDFLKEKGNKEEFDKRIQAALETERQKWEDISNEKLSEAERLAKMTSAEKEKYLSDKRKKELDDREAEITRKELMAEAKNTLTEKKLPVELAEVLNYSDAESCNKSIAAVEKAFGAAVEAAVNERLKGGEPLKKPAAGNDMSEEEKILKYMRGEM